MSLALCRRGDIRGEQIAELDAALTAFYRNPPVDYYQIAEESSQHYNPRELPFHCDLLQRVFHSATLLELGCGTAHLCPHVEAKSGRYTGIDHSEQLMKKNKARYQLARFFSIGQPLEEKFDIVASLYTIEHVVNPVAYLELMWRYCKPGGLIAVICPEFIDCPGFAPSIFFGKTPHRFRDKVRTLDFTDACLHLFEWKIRGQWWKQRARASPPGAFWINMKPRVLHGAAYSVDADAVHLPRLKDLVWHFEQKGAIIEQTSAKMREIAPEILRYNCYVLARKPA